ncbi:hypothetical protein D3Z09_09410 [Rahnella aquatilis]|nr:hypothetical protein D3Z09_09410 [Rahnella aquatilis]
MGDDIVLDSSSNGIKKPSVGQNKIGNSILLIMVYMDVTAIFIWHFLYKKCFSSQYYLLMIATFNFIFVVFFEKNTLYFQ